MEDPIRVTTICEECGALNGSHTMLCQVPWKAPGANSSYRDIICWRCGAVVPSHYTMLWSEYGSACMRHEGLPRPKLVLARNVPEPLNSYPADDYSFAVGKDNGHD
jgi:ribosomal protein L40E